MSLASPQSAPPAPLLAELIPLSWSLAAVQAAPSGDDAPAADTAALSQSDEEAVNEIVVEGDYGPPAGDPAEKFNAESYRITQAVDQAVIEPVAYAYRDALPEPIRDGLGNVVRNLGEPSTALNFLLQGKVGKAFETLGRLAINSTLGVGGLFDIAEKPGIGLPHRRNGFADTMGYYGVGPGPYLYIPVTGSTTVRDLLGRTLDQLLLPVTVGQPFNRPEFAVSYFVINGLDQRIELDAELAEIRASDDPYAQRRDTYLERRRREIAALKGETLPEEEAEAPAPADAEADAPADALPPQSRLILPERVQITAEARPEGR